MMSTCQGESEWKVCIVYEFLCYNIIMPLSFLSDTSLIAHNIVCILCLLELFEYSNSLSGKLKYVISFLV